MEQSDPKVIGQRSWYIYKQLLPNRFNQYSESESLWETHYSIISVDKFRRSQSYIELDLILIKVVDLHTERHYINVNNQLYIIWASTRETLS